MAEFAFDVLSPLGVLGTSLVVIDDDGEVESNSSTGVNLKMRRQFCPLTTASPVPAMAAWRDTVDVYVSSRSELAERFPAYTTIDERVGALAALLLTHASLTVGTLTISFEGPRRFDIDLRRSLGSLAEFLSHLVAQYRDTPHRSHHHLQTVPMHTGSGIHHQHDRPAGATDHLLAAAGPTITIRDVVIDLDGKQVQRADQPLAVTRREFDVLAALASHTGQVLSKRQLLDLVWGYDGYDENVVEANISSLRRKLGREATLIETVRGFGYVIRRCESGGGS